MFTGNQLGQIFCLLLRIAPAAQLVDAKVAVRAVGQPDRGGGARHFFNRHHMLQIAKAKPAILFVYRDAMQTELSHRGPKFVAREPVIGIDFGGKRRDFLAGKTLCRVTDHIRIFAKGEIKAGEIAHGTGMPCVGFSCNRFVQQIQGSPMANKAQRHKDEMLSFFFGPLRLACQRQSPNCGLAVHHNRC